MKAVADIWGCLWFMDVLEKLPTKISKGANWINKVVSNISIINLQIKITILNLTENVSFFQIDKNVQSL